MNPNPEKMIVYGHNFCGQAVSLRRTLIRAQIDHEYRDIMRGNPHWKKELRNLAHGNLSVPTVVFPDGTVFVEPFAREVLEHLGIKEEKFLDKLAGLFKKDES